MADVLAFWAVALVVGALALPIAFALMRRLPDAGAGLAFPLGLLLSGYTYFILRVLDILPPGRGGYLLAVGVLALAGVAVAARDRRFRSTLDRSLPAVVLTVGLFTFLFFVYVAFRSFQPTIGGTEQPMDFLYLNATLVSPDYPPRDPWLAGSPASYYYFGYLKTGLLAAVSGVPASTGYNLGLAYVFAATGTGVVSLAVALGRWALGRRARRWLMAGAAVALGFVLFAGSLSAVFELLAAHEQYNGTIYETFGVEWLIPCEGDATDDCYSGITGPRTTSWYPTEYWFWWRGTRIVPGTITEFPFFSFLLGDLHPHLMAIPLVLLSLGVSAAFWRGRSPLDWTMHRRAPAVSLIVAIVLGGLAFQNAWDVLTFSAVFVVAVFLRNVRARPPGAAALSTAAYAGPILIMGVLAYLPWYDVFRSQASGFFPYTGAGTRPAHAFLQFGPLLVGAALLGSWVAWRDRPLLSRIAPATLWIPLLPLLVWAPLAAYHGDLDSAIEERGGGGWVTLAVYGLLTWLLATAFVQLAVQRRAAAVPAGLAAVGVLLLYGAELFYIRDVFAGSVPRLNTVFKLSYQAWILLSFAAGVGVLELARRASTRSTVALAAAGPVAVVLLAALVYPVTATPNRAEGFDGDTAVDGLAFLARSDPDEYALTRWVRRSTPPGAVIIEASGRTWRKGEDGEPQLVDGNVDYSDAGRVSARTGRATPVGWYFHEIQWRGDSEANQRMLTSRQERVDSVYLSRDPAVVLDVLREFDAEYVVVGRVERNRFPADLMTDFGGFMDLVFESGDVRVYRVPRFEVIATS